MKNFIVIWVNKKTGFIGESKEPMDYEAAQAWCDAMNKEYPYIEHHVKRDFEWVEVKA